MFDQYTTHFEQLLEQARGWYISGAVIGGVLACFFGYRLFRFLVGVVGFIPGFVVGSALGSYLVKTPHGEFAFWAGGLLVGLVGAALAWSFYTFGVFLIGAVFGAGTVLLSAGAGDKVYLLLGGVLGGVLALLLQKPAIILFTSFTGSWSVVSSITFGFGSKVNALTLFEKDGVFNEPARHGWEVFAAFLLLGLAGVAVQYKLLRGYEDEEEEE